MHTPIADLSLQHAALTQHHDQWRATVGQQYDDLIEMGNGLIETGTELVQTLTVERERCEQQFILTLLQLFTEIVAAIKTQQKVP